MINIRRSIFETNSSSVHAICIAKENDYNIPSSLNFEVGEFGWGEDFIYDTWELASYLYTGILCCYHEQKDIEDFKNYIYEVLGKNDCDCTFEIAKHDSWGLSNGYIDHSEDLGEFLEVIRKSEKALLRFLFSADSFIITGNDNSDWFKDTIEETDFSKVSVYYKGN